MKTLRILFLLGMAAFVALSVFCFASCSPFIDTKAGIVSAGFLSSTQGFSGKMKCSDGSTATWSVTGTDGTAVANNTVGAYVTGRTLSAGVQTVRSNNSLSKVQARQPTAQQANARQPTVTTSTAADGSTTQAVTQPAKAIVP